jgi:hypothetical protein
VTQRINRLVRRLRNDTDATLAELQQYNRLIDLIQKADPSDRLGIRNGIEHL